MKTIEIEVVEKVAKSPNEEIVCGNSDYYIKFNFSEEWAEHSVKTARFIYSGNYTDVVFNGDTVQVPVLKNTSMVAVGVFAGELKTTTPALIRCRKSILCENGTPEEPTVDVYNQIIQMINDGMIKGDQGEKGDKGDKGDAGSINFIVVTELPTENIDESAIYMKPKENSEVPNLYDEFIYVNGEWENIGSASVEVDLSEYAKKEELDGKISKVTLNIGNGYGYFDKNGNLTGSTNSGSNIQAATFGNLARYGNPLYQTDDANYEPSSNTGFLETNTPKKPFNCANKKYVDNLPDYLAESDTDGTILAKWKAWLGIE